MIKIDDLRKEHQCVLEDSKYGKEYSLIESVLKANPTNVEAVAVAQKIALIDVTNSTNLSRFKSKVSLRDIVDIILDVDFDNRVSTGCKSLVSDIARKSKEKYGVNLFSFASKYCCYHNSMVYGRDDYSIYDNVVSAHLYQYSTEKNYIKKSTPESWRCSVNYEAYNEFIGAILTESGITEQIEPHRRRMFDHLVWNRYRKDEN